MFKTKVERGTILFLFLVIGFLLLLRQCSSPNGTNVPKEDKSVLKRIETIKYDTINSIKEKIVFKIQYYPKWDSVRKTDTIWNNSLCDLTRFYNDSLVDSNLTIYSDLEVIGMLESSKTSYKLKVPKYIIEKHEIHDTKTIPSRWSLGINGSLGGNANSFNMYIGGDIRIKRVVYGYNYGLLDKSSNIKIGYIIFNSKN